MFKHVQTKKHDCVIQLDKQGKATLANEREEWRKATHFLHSSVESRLGDPRGKMRKYTCFPFVYLLDSFAKKGSLNNLFASFSKKAYMDIYNTKWGL